MKAQKRSTRFLIGLASLLVVLVVGFAWIGATIPKWGATAEEANLSLPGDELAPNPIVLWTHGMTIRATPEEIYPWLIQIGDTRAAFYSYAFIENLFQAASKADYRYINADRVHPEWQNPPKGQGIIANMMAIQEYQPGKYVLATSTPAMQGVQWIWLWSLQPQDQNTTRLIVRHRMQVPPEVPAGLVRAVYNAGFVMERGMMLGIRERAEGNVPPPYAAALDIILWLLALVLGVLAGVRYLRTSTGYHALGVALEAVVFLIIFTFVQPDLWVKVLLDLILLASVAIAFNPGKVTAMIKARA